MPDASEIERRLMDMAAGSGVYVSCGKERIRYAFDHRLFWDEKKKADAFHNFACAVERIFGSGVTRGKDGKSTWYQPNNGTFRSAARKLARLIAEKEE